VYQKNCMKKGPGISAGPFSLAALAVCGLFSAYNGLTVRFSRLSLYMKAIS